ncbi:nuclear transport factor 2 family protein [Pseudomaricurvus alkylphenolicus]|uniref:nuclear transport factor 2 family protein n=1 Tax=Pseudomaricurvus alkylphenolicus TaxID=1306991 RepID=UPI0014218A24|nr:nuclear transport factor 2 family protein [Pseudomaricurvus alkylphenolicus]NIB44890.1 nuclear transport factor 2 family protein [Pseudomaricurvus alkylphenolicus]
MSDSNQEEATIVQLCQKYVDAFSEANSQLMAGVFHETAAIHGHVQGEVWIGDAVALAAFCDSNPPGRETNMTGDIEVLDIFDNSAAVKVAINSYHGLAFTDYFVLQKTDGTWSVVGKSFSGP